MRFYDWQATLSRQTGSQGEFCIIVGAKGIGKTFGLRLQCVNDYLKRGKRFVEMCRTKDECKAVMTGYFDKLQNDGFFTEYQFKTEKNAGYIAKAGENPSWELICYFVALTVFQREKKRTYANVGRVIFDEAVIDKKDKYHRYLQDEFFILANLLDTIFREQADDSSNYRVYLLGNACDLTCPYMQNLGVNTIPKFGYTFYNSKHTLLHYVEPWDAQERQEKTLVGRMLAGTSEADMVFNNRFDVGDERDIEQKTSRAKYAYSLRFRKMTFAVWIDYKTGIFYVNRKPPADGSNVYALTKRDSTLDYNMIRKTSDRVKLLLEVHYLNNARYDSPATREAFFELLGFLGVC